MHTKQDLIDSIKEMKEVYHDADTPQSVKDSIKPSLEKAEKLLAELQDAEKALPPLEGAGREAIHKPTAAEIVKAVKTGKKKVHKATKAPAAPMTKTQAKTLQQIVASAEKYKAYRGKSEGELQRDAARKAARPGKRTSASGKTYYESRANRSDVTAGAPHLEKGDKLYKSMDQINKPTDEEKNTFFSMIQKESHYLNKKPVKDWNEYDLSNWESFIRQGIAQGRAVRKFGINFAAGGRLSDYKVGDNVTIKDEHGFFTVKTKITDVFDQDGVTLYSTEAGGAYMADEMMPNSFAEGGTTASNQITYEGYTSTHLTAEGKQAFEKAISELQSEQDKESVYYKTADKAMETLLKNVDVVLGRPTNKYDASFVHSMLQAIGISNYKTGMLLDTNWLNKELAERKLADGGEIDDDEDDVDEEDFEDEAIEPEKDDCFITDVVRGGYDVSAEGKFLGHYSDYDEVVKVIREWKDKNKYWPNTWSVNERGSATLIDNDGNHLKKGGRLHMAKGGTIENQYIGKTDEQVWNTWTIAQRKHFLHDHNNQLSAGHRFKNIEDIADRDYSQLGVAIKAWLDDHVKRGQYAKGGTIANGTKVTIDAAKLNYQLGRTKSKSTLKYLKQVGTISNEVGVFQHKVNATVAAVKFSNKIINVPMDLLLQLSFAKGGAIKKTMSTHGYHYTNTGGGLTAYIKTFADGNSLYITDEAEAPANLNQTVTASAYNDDDELIGFGHGILKNILAIDTKKLFDYLVKESKGEKDILISKRFAKGGATNNIPADTQEQADAGKVTYRGCGFGSNDVKIKVHGKEYRITNEKFNELGGIKKIKFNAPFRKHMAGGGRTSRAISRDRMFKSKEPHEQAYKRKTSPKDPVYKRHTLKAADKIVRRMHKNKK